MTPARGGSRWVVGWRLRRRIPEGRSRGQPSAALLRSQAPWATPPRSARRSASEAQLRIVAISARSCYVTPMRNHTFFTVIVLTTLALCTAAARGADDEIQLSQVVTRTLGP